MSPSESAIYRDLRTIAWAAHELEKFLGKNSGSTADWPCDICCDNEAMSEELSRLLSELTEALKPFREQMGKA